MRLGLVARCDNTGLGIQTREFYNHLHPAKTLVVDISQLNGNAQHTEWYPDGIFTTFPMDQDIQKFVEDLDIILIAESAYTFYLYDYARYKGVKTVNQYNYEFFDWYDPSNSRPDAFIAPSKWHYAEVKQFCTANNYPLEYLHYPVDRDQFKFRAIKKAKTFIHNVGKPAIYDRNGTYTVIESSKYIKSDAVIKIHFQGEQSLIHQRSDSVQNYYDYALKHGDMNKLTLETIDYDNPANAYAEGDVMLLPRKYGGNCLTLNEALSTGMPTVMTAISPNDQFLPKEWLIPAHKTGEFAPRFLLDIYSAKAKDLAAKIDWFATLDERQMLAENRKADVLAEQICWTVMKPKYETFFENVLTFK